MKFRLIELFGGIGACSKALEKLGVDYEIVDYVEIDKYAVKSFNAIHNTNFDTQDIIKYNKHFDNIDLIMHGSPCQDFSLAGLQAGGDEGSGTRSSLMYETLRIVESLKPKYVIWENVKNIISKKHVHNFNNYINRMSELGYKSFYKVLNAKDYGIPQNRERVFTVSILDGSDYEFPKPIPLKLKLKDMLEENVDKKYYLDDDKIEKISHWKSFQKPFEKVNGNNSIVQTLTARGAGEEHSGMITYSELLDETTNMQEECLNIKNATKKGYLVAHEGDEIYTNTSTKRGTVQKDMIQTLTTFQDKGVVVKENVYSETEEKLFTKEGNIKRYINSDVVDEFKEGQMATTSFPNGYGHEPRTHNESIALNTIDKPSVKQNLRIRKLTPKECWRLMGFDDEDFNKASKVCSDTQLYKQAGNSIVVNVLMAILNNLLKGSDKE